MILLDQVSKSFSSGKEEKAAIENLSIYIPKGVSVAVIGLSGAGKTTLFKLICGLLAPNTGRVKTCGVNPVKERKGIAERVSVLFADISFLQIEQTVEQNMELIRDTFCMENAEWADRVHYLEGVFSLRSVRDRKVKELSLGFRRRVELMAAFLRPYEIMLLDEPCIGLDALAKEAFFRLLQESCKEGKTVLISSHNMGEVDKLAKRICLLHKGKLLFFGEREHLYRQVTPINRMELSFADKLPDMQDLPIVRYEQENLQMQVSFNANHVTAAEIVQTLMETGEIKEIVMMAPTLEDVIAKTAEEKEDTEDR